MLEPLPAQGVVSLAHVARAIQSAPDRLGIPDTSELRSVLVPFADHFVNFATVLRVGWAETKAHDEPLVLTAGEIILLSICFEPSDIAGAADLTAWLEAWRPIAKCSDTLLFHDQVQVQRHASRNSWSLEPCWIARVGADTTEWLNRAGPPGPFLHIESGFFAETIGSAAVHWLGDPNGDQSSHIQNSYRIIVPDPRAWLRDLTIADADLHVEVAGRLEHDVICTTITTDFLGRSSTALHRVTNRTFDIGLELPAQRLQVYLTAPTGAWYDRYDEVSSPRTWGRSVLSPQREPVDTTYEQLRDALEHGESETVEFKVWVPASRAKGKSYELLKAATAFANNRGGVIYIGVTDDCEVVGIEKQLRQEVRKERTTDLDKLQNSYAHLLHRVLNEGISPPIEHSIEWLSHAGLHVLRIDVADGRAKPYQVVEDSAIYVRRGGSDRRASVPDLEQMFKAQS